MLPQYTTHLIQRPCYQRGSPCQDPAANRTTRRPPDHRKETQTAVTWSCLPFIRSGQNNLARHSERGKKTRQTKEEVGKQTSGNGEAWSSAIPEGSGEQGKREETGCEIICGALTTLAIKGTDDDDDELFIPLSPQCKVTVPCTQRARSCKHKIIHDAEQ